MKKFSQQIALSVKDNLTLRYFDESTLFFDIETTGFSAKHCSIYLIGCAYRNGDHLTIQQFFAETPQEEGLILYAFLALSEGFSSTLTFNGLGFDLPFIRERCHLLELPEQLDSLHHIDIFKLISPLKKVLKLPNLKQKSLEQFLSIERKDTYSGGELINIYLEYQKNPSEYQLHLMQLHNLEDVEGMLDILPVLSYCDFFQGDFSFEGSEVTSYQEYEGEQALELVFMLTPRHPLPKRISYGKDDIYLTGFGNTVRLKIKIYQGELKYFYSNYKDYYYLPQEDTAIHKSVAFYVDKNFRTRAKAATCYSRKTGKFLPQYMTIFTPYFKLEYHDKISYIEMTEEFTGSKEFQMNYVLHLLSMLIK